LRGGVAVFVYGISRANRMDGFLAGLALAILPNELPAVLAIFLSFLSA